MRRLFPGACPYCGEQKHEGWCDELLAERERCIAAGKPRPLPIIVTGPATVSESETGTPINERGSLRE